MFANEWLNMQFPSIIYIKIHSEGERLPVLRATQTWQTYIFRKIIFHMSFGLPRPLWTTFGRSLSLSLSLAAPKTASKLLETVRHVSVGQNSPHTASTKLRHRTRLAIAQELRWWIAIIGADRSQRQTSFEASHLHHCYVGILHIQHDVCSATKNQQPLTPSSLPVCLATTILRTVA